MHEICYYCQYGTPWGCVWGEDEGEEMCYWYRDLRDDPWVYVFDEEDVR